MLRDQFFITSRISLYLLSSIINFTYGSTSPHPINEGREDASEIPQSGTANLNVAEKNVKKPFIQGLSSINNPPIGKHIRNFIKTAKKEILIGSDQFKDYEFKEEILNSSTTFLEFLFDIKPQPPTPFEIGVVTTRYDGGTAGEELNPKSRQIDLSKLSYKAIIPKHGGKGKMHSKFVVIDEKRVLTGSSNFTYSGHNLNTESMIGIEHPDVAKLYKSYYSYIIEPNIDHFNDKGTTFKNLLKEIKDFNQRDDLSLKVCMAPLTPIPNFVKNYLKDSTTINISMFLIDDKATDSNNSIINMLLDKLKSDSNLKLKIKVNYSSYMQKRWMQEALNRLLDYNTLGNSRVEIYTSSSKEKLMHDKLILINRNSCPQVLVGSSGFTDHVHDNKNIENMVMVEDKQIHEYFDEHFARIKLEKKIIKNVNTLKNTTAFSNYKPNKKR